MFDQFQAEPTRRRALWLAPLALATVGGVWFRYKVLAPEPLPSADTLPDIILMEFDDAGNRLGEIKTKKLIRTDADWLSRLTPQQYYVTRQHSTDTPYTGTYHLQHTPGIYRCICCATALFSSEQKFDSGTGWPAFWDPIAKENVQRVDDQHGSLDIGIEVLCRKCDAHLGHIFNDGPEPTGLRYCINESSLNFVPKRI